MEPFALGALLGENNRLPDYRLKTDAGSFVRSAVNVDLTDQSTFKRRKGVAQVVAGSDCHSFWSNGSAAYFVDYDTLYHLSAAFVKTAVLTVSPGQQMSFCERNGEAFCSNGIGLWKISGAVATVAGTQPPTLQPTLTAASGGSLPAGIYQASISFLAPDGEESGATKPVTVDVPENGSLSISGIQAQGGHQTCIYLSPPNGDVLYRVGRTISASWSVVVSPSTDSARCRTILLSALPPGQIVREHYSRLLTANGKFLFISEAFAPTLYNPAKSYIPFAENITLVEPCQDGVYVSADQTYWLSGDLLQATITPVLPYKAVIGTGARMPNTNRVWWMSERGMVVAGPGGKVENVQEANVVVDKAAAGASLYREQDGIKQMLSSVFGTEQNVMAASTYMDAEVVRKGTQL